MKSAYFREQQRYTHKAIADTLKLSNEKSTGLIKRLKSYGILKTVRATPKENNLTELLNEEIEIADVDIDYKDIFYVFSFVGIVTVGDYVLKCYPKYIGKKISPVYELKQILKAIKKYNSKEQIINLYNGESENTSFNLLSVILFLINDYNENGIYSNHQDIIEVNGEGEILWDKTINETFAIINNNTPFYTELQTQNSIEDESDYFRKLHQCILTECFNKIELAELSLLFDINTISLYDGDLMDFGDKDYILYRLQRELNIQYITRKQIVLKTLYAYISHRKTFEEGIGISLYGTNSFNLVWENVCAEVFGNMLNTSIVNLPLPIASSYIDRKDKTLSELIEKPLWKPTIEGKSIIKHKAKKTLTPDLISIYKVNNGYCFGIFDAKYYNIKLDEKKVCDQPGVADITKQYLYQLAYQDFITAHGYKFARNAFLFPDEGKEVKVVGEVEMSIFSNLNDSKLKNIDVIKLPAIRMYELYLNNKKLENIATELK
ncbi:LlaJI family restriction endonuclease [Clostridium botulinum]|uniref:LlaJI family restriction endonuclease n=1 Tax=Clostridium botulinum TaxID=1491 RepID=UPI0007749EED|nr:LlaJI family restriction endonuclease [Clostridium botulinum]NFH79652.1 LlaJI family restriction endonuclease [Clostridium botulinum]NFH82503.1 LlaJI family restriction endonuclease [Clostridium botulinum]NFI11236.1 LlaJI family restriction endonuclease [Clostridium botulinum]NFI13557.1 LlaJI family restriction endonuclease [Clostridium botulinum]NFO03834.1 LlaJI family restriction endonuclease [Clostridium botulinum]